MAPRATYGQIPLELHLVVARKGNGSAWTYHHNAQSFNPSLPGGKHPRIGVLDLHQVVILDSPEPYHGILEHTIQNPKIPFEEFLHLFTKAYSATLEAEKLVLSEESVAGVFFNYTKRNGQRVATPVIGPEDGIVDGPWFKSACFKDIPTSCTCGCSQIYHGPSLFLILDAQSWDKRNKGAYKTSTSPYTISFKDDPMVKAEEYPESLLIPVIAKQEISNKVVNAALVKANAALVDAKTALENESKDKVQIQELLKEKEIKVTRLSEEVEALTTEKKDFEEKVKALEISLDSLILKNQELKQTSGQKVTALTAPNGPLVKDIKVLKSHIATPTSQSKQSATSASNRKLLKENEYLKSLIRDLDQNVKVSKEEKIKRDFAAKGQKATQKVNENLKTQNKELKAEVEGLKTKAAMSKAHTTAMEQTQTEESKGLKVRLKPLETQLSTARAQGETELRDKEVATAKYQQLMARIQNLALKDLTASKERAIINSHLERARFHITNNRLRQVISEITALLNKMVGFPMHATVPEFNSHLNDIMQNVGYTAPLQPMAASRPAKRRRVDPVPQTFTASPHSLTGLNPVANENIPESLDPLPVLNLDWAFEAQPQDQVPQ